MKFLKMVYSLTPFLFPLLVSRVTGFTVIQHAQLSHPIISSLALIDTQKEKQLHRLSLKRKAVETVLEKKEWNNLNIFKNENNIFIKSPSLYAAFMIMLATTSSSVAPSMAITSNNNDPNNFNGDYADPLHPLCERHIQVSSDGKTFHYSGTAVGPKDMKDPILRGCTKEEQEKFGLRQGSFDGLIIENGKAVSVGDGIHEGVWEDATIPVSDGVSGGGVDGIRWNDGNKWTKISPQSSTSVQLISSSAISSTDESASKIFGKWFILIYVVFSLLAGLKELVVRVQKRMDSS